MLFCDNVKLILNSISSQIIFSFNNILDNLIHLFSVILDLV